jgi:geranylgeranyl diphosphate synthase type II
MALDFPAYLALRQERIQREIARLTPLEETPPQSIHQAMRYSLFAGGKRVRPLLAVAAAEAAAGLDTPAEGSPVYAAACSLEFIHTYSLIHDDLPALDNDDLRRGRPTCHVKFGEAMAILAGDALLTLAFQVLAQLDCPAATKVRMIAELATAAGTVGGMIAGQVHDIEGEKQQPDAEILERIHRAKTGALLRASVRIGALAAGASQQQYEALSRYGEHIGLAFQIVDDVLDVEQSSEALGKTAGKDAAQHKITFPAVYGITESRRMAAEQLALAHAAIDAFGESATGLRSLADLIVHRSA